jgi:hypothetical protein
MRSWMPPGKLRSMTMPEVGVVLLSADVDVVGSVMGSQLVL